MFKADVDSAFRTMPIKPKHRKFANIFFVAGDVIYTATHLAMMFGSIASVHSWHRLACLLRAIGRRLLRIPLLCFVDDCFSVDREDSVACALQSFVRIVLACLGDDAISPSKVEAGNPLVVLGVEIAISKEGACFWPAQDKVDRWSEAIENHLQSMVMTSGQASKLSGQLAWASQCAFRRLGRAFLRPIIRQINSRSSAIQGDLRLALEWWREVLAMQLKQERSWRANEGQQLHMFVDARSTPPHLGAVLFRCASLEVFGGRCAFFLLCDRDGVVYFCDLPAPASVMGAFRARADGQIMGLEILSIALGASIARAAVVRRRLSHVCARYWFLCKASGRPECSHLVRQHWRRERSEKRYVSKSCDHALSCCRCGRYRQVVRPLPPCPCFVEAIH